MTIETSIYIHNMLKENVDANRVAMNEANQIAKDAEVKGAPNAKYLRELYEEFFKMYRDSYIALKDFEHTYYGKL